MARFTYTLTFTGTLDTTFDAADADALATLGQQIAENPIDWLCDRDEECDLTIDFEPAPDA
jgi:hypothetical protein